jgi:hypothetical protein
MWRNIYYAKFYSQIWDLNKADIQNLNTGCSMYTMAVFRSKFWSAKIHCSISFVFGNNYPTID